MNLASVITNFAVARIRTKRNISISNKMKSSVGFKVEEVYLLGALGGEEVEVGNLSSQVMIGEVGG